MRNMSIYHRDIKPANILKMKSGNYKIADFGVSKMYEFNMKKSIKSSKGHTIMGTPAYLSPLLYNAYKKGKVEVKHDLEKSDLFSFGITLL
jgi:serine/threonine protein kinase